MWHPRIVKKRSAIYTIIGGLFAYLFLAVGPLAPAMAAPYNGTSGDVPCTTGFFTITSNKVTGHTGCAGSAVIPEGVTDIDSQAFYRGGAATLTSVTLPSTLVTIGDFAFWTVPLTSITIPGKVTSIGGRAFSDSAALTNVTFLEGSATTLTIGLNGFYNGRFTSITLPTRLTSLDPGTFNANPNIQKINFLGTEPSVSANLSLVSSSTTVYANASAGFSASGTPLKWKGLNFVSVAPPAFSYSSSPQTASVGTPITNATVTSTGDTITSYSISPAISNTPGLTFDTSTGSIAGTPTQVAVSRTYTVTATGTLIATSTSTYAITVNAASTSNSTSNSAQAAADAAAQVQKDKDTANVLGTLVLAIGSIQQGLATITRAAITPGSKKATAPSAKKAPAVKVNPKPKPTTKP
jgi:BspA type Leucine rich repeat region (6 copies)